MYPLKPIKYVLTFDPYNLEEHTYMTVANARWNWL